MAKKTGIWMDGRVAEIFTFEDLNEQPNIEIIKSGIEEMKPRGGSRSKQPYGPMETVSESKFLEKRKHQEVAFFKDIYTQTKGGKDLYVFGPSTTKNKFVDYLKEHYSGQNFNIVLRNSDHPTQKQKAAEIRRHFVIEFKKTRLAI